MKKIFIFIVLSLSINAFAKNPVVLISIDGFANNYLTKFQPKNLLALGNEGVRAKAMFPVFPSKTFPNHLSIVTGVYPAKHGIIHNSFYHPILKQNYYMGAGKDNKDWLTAMPIWTLAEKQGVKTALYFWPESEAKIAGQLPSYYFPYKKSTPNKTRINQVLTWLKLPESKRPQFIATYFSVVDSAGHHYGTNSKQLKQTIGEIDQLIGSLKKRILNETNLEVDIIIVSDHGMTTVDKMGSIDVGSLFKENDKLNVVNGQTQLNIYSKDKSALFDARSQLLEKLTNKADSLHGKYQVFTKGNYPAHWHLDSNAVVIPDMIVSAIPPFIFLAKDGYASAATHGFDPKGNADLNAIFIAQGPSFNKKVAVDEFKNIDVFALLIKLLELDVSPLSYQIDGSITSLKPALKEFNSHKE